MLEFVDDDVARITDFGSLDGNVDLVPLGRIETFCPVLQVESHLVGFCLRLSIFLCQDIEGDAGLRNAVGKSVMINSSVTLADFRGVDEGFLSVYRCFWGYARSGIKGREEPSVSCSMISKAFYFHIGELRISLVVILVSSLGISLDVEFGGKPA